MDGRTNPFANFVSALQEDERRVKGLFALSSIRLQLSSLELNRLHSLLHPVSTPGETDTLPQAIYRLGNFGNDLNVGTIQPDVVIEIKRSTDGSLIVFPVEVI